MANFTIGDRVYLKDVADKTSPDRLRERLGRIVDLAESASGEPQYVLEFNRLEGESRRSEAAFPEGLLEPAGEIGIRYEQVLGPYPDFEFMVKAAVDINQRLTGRRDIDILGINWPDWMTVVEIRNNAIDVPAMHTGFAWAWHVGVLTR
jgi:hypothetical protein